MMVAHFRIGCSYVNSLYILAWGVWDRKENLGLEIGRAVTKESEAEETNGGKFYKTLDFMGQSKDKYVWNISYCWCSWWCTISIPYSCEKVKS